MTTASIGMCKDELDIAEAHIRRMASQVDFMLVLDNGSTDGTRELLQELARELPLSIFDDQEVGYYQARKITELARMAGERGARWVLPADFDEIWYSQDGRIADVLGQRHLWHSNVAIAALWDHVPTGDDDPTEPDPVRRMRWRWRERSVLHKVACRAKADLWIEQGNHNARYSQEPLVAEGLLQVRHFPYRSAEQFVRKVRNGARAYAASDLPETMGAHWRSYGRILEDQGEQVLIEQVYRRWFFRADPTTPTFVGDERLPDLVLDPVPCSVSTS